MVVQLSTYNLNLTAHRCITSKTKKQKDLERTEIKIIAQMFCKITRTQSRFREESLYYVKTMYSEEIL